MIRGNYKVEVADEVAITSSIMPQKKNPVTLEHIKGKAGHLLGALVDTLSVQKNVNFMHCIDLSTEAVAPIWGALNQAEAMVHLAKRIVTGLQVRKELMARRAGEDFCTATELADFLVREKGLPFRTAHAIVGNVVVYALEQGLRSNGITSGLIDRAAREVVGKPLNLTGEQVKQALDPPRNLEGKKASGSPAVPETKLLINKAKEGLECQRSTAQEWRERLQRAREELDREVTVLVKPGRA